MDWTLEQIVTFCILMESGEGVLTKSPDYIEEKLTLTRNLDHPEVILDMQNHAKFDRYIERWRK